MNKYELIFESIQEALDNNEITLEEAEFLNDYAYDRYITEDGHSKKLKARHNAQKKKNEKKFYDAMNYKHDHTDKRGNKYGNVSIDGNKEIPITIYNKKFNMGDNDMSHYNAYYSRKEGNINVGRKHIRMKGSDLLGAHEYSHAMDDDGKAREKLKNMKKTNSNSFNKKQQNKIWDESEKSIDSLSKKDNFDKKFETEKRKLKKEKNRSLNSHDKSADEIRADITAINHVNKEHGANIIRKHLNELTRRDLQSCYGNDTNLFTYGANDYLYAKQNLPKLKKQIKDKNKKISELDRKIKEYESKSSKDNKEVVSNPFRPLRDIYGDLYRKRDDKMKSTLEESIKRDKDKKERLQKMLDKNKKEYKESRKRQTNSNNKKMKTKQNIANQQNKDRVSIADKLAK